MVSSSQGWPSWAMTIRSWGKVRATSSKSAGRANSSLLCSVELANRMNQDGHPQFLGLGVKPHGPGIAGMEILIGRGKGDSPKLQMVACGVQFVDGRPFGGIDAGESYQFLGKAIDVLGDIGIGDFRLKVFAFEPQDDGFVHDGRLGPMMIGIGGR